MSRPIFVALVCLGLMALGQIAMAFHEWQYTRLPLLKLLSHLSIDSLLALGIVRGHRLAWQWARIISLIGSISGLFALAMFGSGFAALMIALLWVPAIGIFMSLGTADALEHFHLICTSCGKKNPKAGDFLFKTARCRGCGEVF